MLPDHTFIVVAKDVSKRHEMELQLKNSEKKFRSLFQSSNDAILLMDYFTIIDCNPKAEQLFGKLKSDIVGKSPIDFAPKTQPDGSNSHKSALKIIGKVYNGEPQLFEWTGLADGKEIHCEINLSQTELDDKTILIAILRDISERKKIEKELIEAKEKAEEMNNLKSTFLANLSHELRTPMVGILGFTEILEERLKDSFDIEMIQTINLSSRRLLDTLNLILDLSRIESNNISINYTKLNLTKEIISFAKVFEGAAENKGLDFSISSLQDDVSVLLDKKMLEQIMNNLLNNAIKFTNEGSIKVQINSESINEKKWAIVKVSDTGIGIPSNSLNIIFEEFRQVSEGLNRSFEGTGLGLTITKKAVELMGGNIFVDSTENIGTTFTIRFPAIDLDSADSKPQKFYKVKNQQIIPRKLSDKVLVVENEKVSRDFIKFVLHKHFNIDMAEDGPSAIRFASQNTYSLILMDIGLGSEMSGVQAAAEIKRISGYDKVPIIAITAYAMKGDKENFLSQGFSHYLSKPYTKDELLQLINEIAIKN